MRMPARPGNPIRRLFVFDAKFDQVEYSVDELRGLFPAGRANSFPDLVVQCERLLECVDSAVTEFC